MERIDLPTFIAGLVAGFLAFNNEPWWFLTGPTSGIVSIQASPFFLQISAIGIPATTPVAMIMGSISRILLIMTSFALVGSSFRVTSWWRPMTMWLGLSSLTEVFFSLFLLIHAGQAALYSTYGANPPTIGTLAYPARVVGTDLNTYFNPSLTAAFNLDFYLGLVSLATVGTTTILKMLRDQDLISLSLLSIKEFFLSPPYRQVWISTSDKELNPLNEDPETTSDDKLLQSFGKIYSTVQPGGTVSIILPSWATSVTDRFQKLLSWTGFAQQSTETIYRSPAKPETQLLFRKPLRETSVASEPSPASTFGQSLDVEEPQTDAPQQLSIVAQPEWSHAKVTRQERAMLKAAVTILSRSPEPVPYRELLNQVYMELIEKEVLFESARDIETALLKHEGRELALLEETDRKGFKTSKKWTIGEKKLRQSHDTRSVFKRLKGHHPHGPPVVQFLKWQRRSKYKPKRRASDDDD